MNICIKNYNKLIALDFSFNLIQEIRLAHALAESDFDLCVNKNQAFKFAYLRKIFGTNFFINRNNAPFLSNVHVSHRDPFSQIGTIKKPLIFPHGAFDYCFRLWSRKRRFLFSFIGLMTEKRKISLEYWLLDYFPNINFNFDQKAGLAEKVKKTILNRKIFNLNVNDVDNHKFLIRSSSRGRSFPIKIWDNDYFKILSDSEFVFCFRGDYIWTYRFFESIMCGAIPIIESFSPIYKDFIFYTLKDEPKSMVWTEEKALYNYRRCFELLTIPKHILNREICSLLD